MNFKEYTDERAQLYDHFWEMYPKIKNLSLGYKLKQRLEDPNYYSPSAMKRLCTILEFILEEHNNELKKEFLFTTVVIGVKIGEDKYILHGKKFEKQQ